MDYFKRKRILITGGTGTLGKALVKKLLSFNPKQVVVFSRDEIKQLELKEELKAFSDILSFKIGDVRDKERLTEVLEDIEVVVHTAALKHVVVAEENPNECLKTNVEGSRNIVEASIENEVGQCLLISSDKAESPVGVYGKSKKEAEVIFKEAKSSCLFQVVRLGNIVGSRGSVFEVFRNQRKSGVLQVSHPEATRFFISLADSVDIIISSLTNKTTFSIPEMIPRSILDIANEIGPECEVSFTGLRKGDNLHEVINGRSSSDALKEKLVAEL